MLDCPAGHVFEVSALQSLPPRQRLHLILLDVDSVERSTAFYEALGWRRSPTGNAGFAKFDLGGYALCLISREGFAKDAGFDAPCGSGFAGYFADPDGHLFEVDREGAWVFDDDHRLVVDRVNN